MVRIDYINGDSETVETIEKSICFDSGLPNSEVKLIRAGHFRYDSESQIFIVYDHDDERDCMMIPREFIKSIRYIEV